MTRRMLGAALALPLLVTACGSGDNGTGQADASYGFVVPQLNSERNYARTTVDNSNNTIDATFSLMVTDVNPDGSYVDTQAPTSIAVVVDGTNYAIPTETIDINNQGQETASTTLEPDGTVLSCEYSPHGPGPGYPLSVGQAWSIQFTQTCGTAAPVSYTQTGNVLDVETWTDASGTTITQTITNWRDVNTMFSVKATSTRVYSGTLPANGYPVSITTVLQSES